MACKFLTFQLIFPVLAAIKVVVLLDLVLKVLCLCDFLGDPIWFYQEWMTKWIDSIYILSVFRSISSLNRILDSRLKYSTTSLTSKFEYLIDISNLMCQSGTSHPLLLSHLAAHPVFSILINSNNILSIDSSLSYPIHNYSSNPVHSTFKFIYLYCSLYNSWLTVSVSF